MAIPPEKSVVTVDKRPYRKIAQENWGLTDEQMKGMHVHHRIPVSNGGTNDPSNLYVCSPSFHQNVWHNGESWIKWATAGGKKGGPLGGRTCKEGGVGIFAEGSHSAAGKLGGPRGVETQRRQGIGLFGLSSGQRSENTKKQWEDPEYRELMKEVAIRSGRNLFVNKLGAHAEENLGKGAKTTNSTLWVDPDHPELGAHHFRRLGKFQREAGLPDGKSHRVKL